MSSISIEHKRILIIKLSAIGDVVMTTPVAKALRNAFPDSYIAWVVEDKSQNVLIGNPYIDELIIWKRKQDTSFIPGKIVGFWSGLAKLKSDLRARKFDLAIDFQGLFRSALVTAVSGAKHRVGYDNAGEGAALFYNMHLPSRQLRVRSPQQYLNMLQFLGIYSEDLDTHVPVDEDDRAFAREFLAEAAPSNPHRKMIMSLCPATTWRQKHWTEEGWARLTDILIAEYDALPVFMGSSADTKMVKRIQDMMKYKAVDASGKTTLKQAAAIMEQSDLVIAVDTGLLHIAMAIDRPIVGIFGPTRWRHLIKKESPVIVVKEFPCMPCLRHPTCKDFDCMRAITPEDVLAAARPWLKRKAKV